LPGAFNIAELLAIQQALILMGVWCDSIRIRNQSLKKLRRELYARNIKKHKAKSVYKKDGGIVFFLDKVAPNGCRISSYLQTMSNKGINPLIAIQMALSGEIYKNG
jgi:hypothetical protein